MWIFRLTAPPATSALDAEAVASRLSQKSQRHGENAKRRLAATMVY
jgi:hypothetical protein